MTTAVDPLFKQVKSALLPPSRWEGILEWLIERLPRRLIRVELEPNGEVEVIDASKGEYKSTGFAPSFAVRFVPRAPQRGWYYIEAAIVRNNGNREASIRAILQGMEEPSIIIPIPTNLRGTVREVFFLPANDMALTWSPTAAPGFFSQSPLLIHRITLPEGMLRRICRVLDDLWRFRAGPQATRAGLTWWGAISNLQDSYRRTADLRMKRLMGHDYAAFIAANDTLKRADIRAMRRQVMQFPVHPVISLIMPVQAPTAQFFRAALDSVSGQIYPHWELLLAGDFSEDTVSHAIANEYRSRNVQITIVRVTPGADLAATLNSALHLAQGEFVARINQNDLIPPHALFFLAKEINTYPDAELLYTDDDSIDEANRRLDPRFKPDWNPDLFFSCNYFSHLTLYRLVRALASGAYRPGFEGAEDYDLTLRYIRDLPPNRIRHIPRILCHRRTQSQACASPPSPPLSEAWGETARANQSAKRALAGYFEGSGITVEDGPSLSLCRIRYPLPAQPPLVSIIIPTRDRADILSKCIESIRQKTDYGNWEMLIVDNQSTETAALAYLADIQEHQSIRVLRYDKPFNYSAINNFAVQHANGEVLALLNNDVEVISRGWLAEMVSHAIRPGVGAVGAKLLYSNGTVQHAGVILGLGGVAGHAHKYLDGDDPGYGHRAVVTQDISAVTGACLVVKKTIYEEVGGLNEVDLVVALNDVDFCLRLREKGYRNIFTPYAKLFHHESISRGHDDTPEKHALFVREFEYMKNTWGHLLMQDPAYNPNLTREYENFSLNQLRVNGRHEF